MNTTFGPIDLALVITAAALFGGIAGYAVRWVQERRRGSRAGRAATSSRPDPLRRVSVADTWLPGRGFATAEAASGAGESGESWSGRASATFPPPGTDNPLVLVVDDRLELRAVHGAYLQKHGYEVLTAADGETALELVQAHHPAVVVLDHSLPRRTGIEVARLLRADPLTADIPIILISAHSYGAIGKAARDAGVAAFLPKPVDPSRVLREVDRLVGVRPQH